MKNQCSDLFVEAFSSHSGGLVRDCACGRTHFENDEGGSWEEGELQEFQRKAIENPNDYIQHDDTSVNTMNFNGAEVVIGCTCELAYKFEQAILNNAECIATYLNGRAEMLINKANAIRVKDASKNETV